MSAINFLNIPNGSWNVCESNIDRKSGILIVSLLLNDTTKHANFKICP